MVEETIQQNREVELENRRLTMSRTISLIQIGYLYTVIFIAIPSIAITVYNFSLFSSTIGKIILFASATWILGGFALLHRWEKIRTMRLARIVQEATPNKFFSAIELISPHSLEYLTISPTTGEVVIVSVVKNIARCEPISFIQCWKTFEDNQKFFITVCFNDFEFSSMTIRIGKNGISDLNAKMRFALNFQTTI